MNVWVWSAGTSTAIGGTVFFLILLPVLMWQFRKFGRLSFGRLIGAAAVSVYTAALVVYTQLPLPETRSGAWCEAYGVTEHQLIPFESFRDVAVRSTEIGWPATLTSQIGLQLILNAVLFIPWGMIVKRYFQRSVLVATMSGLLMSVFIETTQMTGVWGIYPCAYRLGDIDDVITNTTGAFIGALLAPLLLFWMPKSETLLQGRLKPRSVTGLRRFIGMVFNYGLVWSVTVTTSMIVHTAWRLIDGKVHVHGFAWVEGAIQAMAIIVIIFVPALRGRGSLGLSIVWLTPKWRRKSGQLTSGTFVQRLARASVLGVPFLIQGIPGEHFGDTLFFLLVLVSAVMIPLTQTNVSLSGWITRAEIVDSRVSSPR